jgi:uncharacterized membrane protein
MPHRILAVVQLIHDFAKSLSHTIKTNVEVVSGGFTGTVYGVVTVEPRLGSMILTAFLTGVAGSLGGLLLKEIYGWVRNKLKKK